VGQTANSKLGRTIRRSDASTCSHDVPVSEHVSLHIEIIRYDLVCLLPNMPLNTFTSTKCQGGGQEIFLHR
jgi:hypothetical protein